MRTVNYSEVLQLLSELAGIPYADLPTATALTYRGALSRYFRKAWEVEYWPELTRTDQRYYRPVWAAGTTYAAATEVFFKGNGAASQSYFQSLRTGMPLTVNTLTRVTTTATATTSAVHNLVTGDWVTITGASPAGYNLTAQITRTGASTFTYTLASDPGASGSGTMRCSPNPESSTGTTCLGWWHPLPRPATWARRGRWRRPSRRGRGLLRGQRHLLRLPHRQHGQPAHGHRLLRRAHGLR